MPHKHYVCVYLFKLLLGLGFLGGKIGQKKVEIFHAKNAQYKLWFCYSLQVNKKLVISTIASQFRLSV